MINLNESVTDMFDCVYAFCSLNRADASFFSFTCLFNGEHRIT
jgi:hypothetical protein